MNLKQLSILILAVLIIGGAGLVVYKKQQSSWSGGQADLGRKLLGDFPVNDVAQIVIHHGTNELHLIKQDDLWRVRERNNYPANYADISGFLLKARELKITQSEPVGPSQLPRLQLGPGDGTNSAVRVELLAQDGKPLRTLLLGKKHMTSPRPSPMGEGGDEGWPDGRYVMVGNSGNVAVIKEPLENLEPKPEQWVSKDFFKVEKARDLAVDFPISTNSWKLTRETDTGEWKLADAKPGEELDSSKTSSLSSPLSSPTFDNVLPAARFESAGTNGPDVVKINTFDNFHYTLTVGQKTNDDYPLNVAVTAEIARERTAGKDEKPEDKAKLDKDFKDSQQKLEDKLKQEQGYGKWTYLVSSWSLEPLLKERSQLLVEKKAETEEGTNAVPSALSTNDLSMATNRLPSSVGAPATNTPAGGK